MKSFVTKLCCFALFCGISMFLLESCSKETLTSTQSQVPVNLENLNKWQQTPDNDLVLLSKALASAQKRPEVIDFLDSWFKKDQFGEGMVFLLQVQNLPVNENQSFKDILSQEIEKINGVSLRNDYLGELIADYPNLGFSIYTGSDDISINDFEYSYSVKVVPETQEFRQADERFEKGYDENLNEKDFSNNEAPNEAVIIVSNSSEWIMLNAETGRPFDGSNTIITSRGPLDFCDDLAALIQEGEDEIDAIIMDGGDINSPGVQVLVTSLATLVAEYNFLCVEDDDDNGGGGDPPGDGECDRDAREENEELVRIRIVHSELAEFCKWYKKTCEISIRQVFVVNPDALAASVAPEKFIIARRKSIKKHQWYVPEIEMERFRFLEGIHGDAYTVSLVGHHHNPDGGQTFGINFKPTVKFKVGIGEISVSTFGLEYEWTIANNDNNLGGNFVEYCDPANGLGTQYSTGKADYNVKEHE